MKETAGSLLDHGPRRMTKFCGHWRSTPGLEATTRKFGMKTILSVMGATALFHSVRVGILHGRFVG
jgi:hypothetical protein